MTEVGETILALDDERAVALAGELAAKFVAGSSDRDRDRALPEHEIETLAASGLLGASVPAGDGGPDVTARTVTEVIRRLAVADPNVAEISQTHFVYLNLLKVAATPHQRHELFASVLDGALLASATTEPADRPGLPTTRLSRAGAGAFKLNGVKTASTGAPFAKWIATLARLDDGSVEGGEELIAFVPRDASGVSIVDEWDGMGQRTTGSSNVIFEDVRIPGEHVLRRAKAFEAPRGYGAYAQLLHAAVEVGIARAALADATDFVRTTSRPDAEAFVARACDDPLLIQRFGELTVDVRGAEAALRIAADAVDDVLHRPGDETAAEASLSVATVRVLAEHAAITVSNAIFEVAGPASVDNGFNLHRHWRNARTHSLKDPIRWKYHHLGRYTVLGVRPPRYIQV